MRQEVHDQNNQGGQWQYPAPPPGQGYPQPPPYPPGGYQYQGGYPQQPGGYPNAYGNGYPYPPYQQGYGPHQSQPHQPQGPTHASHLDHDHSVGASSLAPDGSSNRRKTSWEIPADKLLDDSVDVMVRHGFIRKVYGILTCQLVVTFGLALWFNLHDAAAAWLFDNYWLAIVAMVTMCCSVCALACVPGVARKAPTNYILLGTISAAMGVTLGYCTGAVSTPAFALACGMTAAVTLAVSLFACQTKWDFTGMGPYMLALFMILMVFGLACIFIRNRIVQLVYAGIGAAVFSIYIIIDTQKIVGGKHRKYEFSIDDYAFAALALYLDIINLFMYILQILALTGDR